MNSMNDVNRNEMPRRTQENKAMSSRLIQPGHGNEYVLFVPWVTFRNSMANHQGDRVRQFL